MEQKYYRPEWTCGKYNSRKHVAIMFNLISNGEYFFEEESADVINMILSVGRNGEITVSEVSSSLNIESESISPFFETLEEIGLLSRNQTSQGLIDSYRKKIAEQPLQKMIVGDDADSFIKCSISSVEQAYAEAVQDSSEITSVLFELTYRCSEQCLHCYNPGATRNNKEKSGRNAFAELSFAEYRRIIDDMCDGGLVSATITGGDPFSNNDIWDILEYLYQKDIAVTILTNGQRIMGQVERLAKLYPRSVRLSLYSADSKIHDSITRKKGSWHITIDVIKGLRQFAVPVVINCVIMRPALKTYLGIKDIAKQLSCAVLFDYNVVDSIDGDLCASHNLRLIPEELEALMTDPDIEPKAEYKELYSNPAPVEKGLPCQAGNGTFCVMPDGKLVPCVSFHMILGDLKVHNFHEIVQESPQLQKLLNAKASDYFECGTHDYCSCCMYCAGNSYSEHNTPFSANENNCYVARNRHSFLSKSLSGINALGGKTLQEYLHSIPDFELTEMQREYK